MCQEDRVAFAFAITALLILILLNLFACAYLPCTYDGKAVSQRDANYMKGLGMHVVCPGQDND